MMNGKKYAATPTIARNTPKIDEAASPLSASAGVAHIDIAAGPIKHRRINPSMVLHDARSTLPSVCDGCNLTAWIDLRKRMLGRRIEKAMKCS